MIRLLVRFASWLDRRFPPKLSVRSADWDSLCAKTDSVFSSVEEEKAIVRSRLSALETKLENLETAVSLLKDAASAAGNFNAAKREEMRREFIENPQRFSHKQ